MLIMSVVAVYGMYLLGKEIYNKKVGLLAAFLFSLSYLPMFYTFRLLVEVPALLFFVFSCLFLVKYIKFKKPRDIYLAAVMSGIGTLFKLPVATVLMAMFIYLLITEKFSFFKRKEIWFALLIYFLVLSPYIIWGYFQFGSFVITGAGGWNAPQESRISNLIDNLFLTGGNYGGKYIRMPIGLYSWPVLVFLIIGIILMYEMFLKFDIILKDKENGFEKELFLLLMLLIPVLVAAYSVNYSEDRLIIGSIVPGFIIASSAVFKISSSLFKKYKMFTIICLLAFLCLSAYLLASASNNLIISKKDSYGDFKEMGKWLKENSQENEVAVCGGWPMMQYYSERKTIRFPDTKEEFLILKNNTPELKYFILSAYQKSADWSYAYPQENNLTAVNAYFADKEQKQPLIVVYKI
ncbi:hypothetical protein A3K73_01805 [Candidatus Pacearchaeota archaeon RBG_13_36_9]|nr:MAG: hypothetical protein A3K73_01805 [Candidatus Pacearchaeota archaeon RBG_13_36_9]